MNRYAYINGYKYKCPKAKYSIGDRFKILGKEAIILEVKEVENYIDGKPRYHLMENEKSMNKRSLIDIISNINDYIGWYSERGIKERLIPA